MMSVHWDKPLEVVNRDNGETHRLGEMRANDNKFWPFIALSLDEVGKSFFINKNSKHHVNEGMSTGDWIVRNCAAQPSPDLQARCVALVQRIAAFPSSNDLVISERPGSSINVSEEARSIIAAMRPIDADLIEARELYAQRYEEHGDHANAMAARRGDWDNVDGYIPWLVKALQRGRELGRGS